MASFDSIILVDKPAGLSSFGVVARVRRQLTEAAGQRVKVGHCGTLDPFATGLLILVSGKFTRQAGEFSKLDKVYEATIRLGATSTTGDPEGEIVTCYPKSTLSSRAQSRDLVSGFSWHTNHESRSKNDADSSPLAQNDRIGFQNDKSRADIIRVLKQFTGKITQTPPIYSAIKIGGQRAYKLARQGKTPEIPSRQVEIYALELLEYQWPMLKIRAHVSSGTYIRTLAEDIGRKLGTGAYCAALRRIKIGDYDIKMAEKIVK